MEFHRPRRLLGLFGKRSSTTSIQAEKPTKQDSSSDESSRSDDDSSSSGSGYTDDAAIRRLTEQRDAVAEELRCTKQDLEKEIKVTKELNQKLIMKSISVDCQLAEAEEKFSETKLKIDSVNQENTELTAKVRAIRMENHNLMKRTAALARRDQIQKATIMASNSEIIKLMTTVESFQDRFMTLHEAVKIHKEKYPDTPEKEEVPKDKKPTNEESEIPIERDLSYDDASVTPFELDHMSPSEQEELRDEKNAKEEYLKKRQEFEAIQKEFKAKQEKFEAAQEEHRTKEQEWNTERDSLFDGIAKLKSNNKEIKKKFVQTLKKHQWKWHKEKEKLRKKVGDLEVRLEEKEAELLITQNLLANAWGNQQGQNNNSSSNNNNNNNDEKGDLKRSDTYTTLTTADDSISTCSSTSMTIAHSLTETTNNTYEHKVKHETMSVFEEDRVNDDNSDIFRLVNSLSTLSELKNNDNKKTPLKSNGPSRRDDQELPKHYIATPPTRKSATIDQVTGAVTNIGVEL